MRFLVLVSLTLTGCVQIAEGIAINTAIEAAVDAPFRTHGDDRVRSEPVRPPSAEDLRDRETISRARELTSTAVAAARRGDCNTVSRIRAAVLLLPEVRLEGGVHDVIFLRDPAIVQCLAARAS
jgi:hypothetical protein